MLINDSGFIKYMNARVGLISPHYSPPEEVADSPVDYSTTSRKLVGKVDGAHTRRRCSRGE